MDLLADKKLVNGAARAVKRLNNGIIKRKAKKLHSISSYGISKPDAKVFLVVSLVKIPRIPPSGQLKVMTIRSKIPHNFVGKESDVLYVVSTPRRKNALKARLIRANAPDLITEILTVKELRTNYKDYETRRTLAGKYDVVLCDLNLVGKLYNLLGKPFYNNNKRPIGIDRKNTGAKETITTALSKSYLYLKFAGSCATCQVGRTSQTDEQLAENIMATVENWKNKIPGGWINVASIHVKSSNSKSIPLYISKTTPNEVPEVVNPASENDEILAVDDLNTFWPGLVGVKKSGDVVVLPKHKQVRRKVIKRLKTKQPADRINPTVKYWTRVNKRFDLYGKENLMYSLIFEDSMFPRNAKKTGVELEKSKGLKPQEIDDEGVVGVKWDEVSRRDPILVKGDKIKKLKEKQEKRRNLLEEKFSGSMNRPGKKRGKKNRFSHKKKGLTIKQTKELLINKHVTNVTKHYDGIPGWGFSPAKFKHMKKEYKKKVRNAKAQRKSKNKKNKQ